MGPILMKSLKFFPCYVCSESVTAVIYEQLLIAILFNVLIKFRIRTTCTKTVVIFRNMNQSLTFVYNGHSRDEAKTFT
jgi:hypothetical protein